MAAGDHLAAEQFGENGRCLDVETELVALAVEVDVGELSLSGDADVVHEHTHRETAFGDGLV